MTLYRDEPPGEGLIWEYRWHPGTLSVDSRSSANGSSNPGRHQMTRAPRSWDVCPAPFSRSTPPQCIPVAILQSWSGVLAFEPAQVDGTRGGGLVPGLPSSDLPQNMG